MLAKAKAANAMLEVFEIRVTSKTGLLYVSRPTRGRASELGSVGAGPAAVKGSPPSSQATDSTAAAVVAAETDAARPETASPQLISLAAGGWVQMRAKQRYPYSAIGWLHLMNAQGEAFSACTGNVFGTYAVVTAGVPPHTAQLTLAHIS